MSKIAIAQLHCWNVSLEEARQIQSELQKKLIIKGELNPRFVAGADCAFSAQSELAYAVVVVYDLTKDKVVDLAKAKTKLKFPYIPRYLTFREGPCLIEAFSLLKIKPDVIIFDGQGIAHPRRMGIASHMGLWLKIPSIGCAKSRLWGKAKEPENYTGAFEWLYDGREVVGALVRTKKNVKPVVVSPGHLISPSSAIDVVLKCTRGYRLPEPTRIAHLEANRFKKEQEG